MGNSKSSVSQQEQFKKLKKQLQNKQRKIKQLKLQRDALMRQAMPSNKLSKQYNIQTLMQMNYQMFTCLMCQNFFDQSINLPIMVCKKQHTICQSCFQRKQMEKQNKCFQCNQKFQNLGKNRSILNLIKNKQELLEWVKEKDTGKNELKQAQSQSQLSDKTSIHMCKFLNYSSMFQINGDSLLKISPQTVWHTVRSVQSLPAYNLSETSFKIISSLHNSLIIGITIQTQQFQKGFIPSNSVAFHLNNGHIYDQFKVNEFKWRSGGTAVIKNTNPRLIMSVNPIKKKVQWRIQKKVYGESKIPQKFINQPIYAFVAVYHKGDMIVLNK